MLGCKADGKHLGCRFCGVGDFEEIACPSSLCTFPPASPPAAPYRYYWEPKCYSSTAYVLGCNADGIHPECRFCGTQEFTSIECPIGAAIR
jgi:ribosomal protein L37E